MVLVHVMSFLCRFATSNANQQRRLNVGLLTLGTMSTKKKKKSDAGAFDRKQSLPIQHDGVENNRQSVVVFF